VFVKMRESVAGRHFAYRVGEVVDLQDELAEKWIESGSCEPYSAPAATAGNDPHAGKREVSDPPASRRERAQRR